MSKKGLYKTSDGQYELPAGVSMREAMQISKADAVIRMACAIEHSRKLTDALAHALGPMGIPAVAVVNGEDHTTRIYQLGKLVVVFDEEDRTLLTFDSFEKAVEFWQNLASKHNLEVLKILKWIITMQAR